ncbi:hypothetical protein [Actinacidiphila acididurans]|uniref:Uncharacterized protein n=1 Tax=Actinacidiphila acididurans TaxID=2784346 RepID=A0ABS2U352_9ACTN|nr:hypothetical protein [Actinacidiphila acididurans]MBM9510025.1 hypothetical protein [Actinacidiphila acididurans]
MTAAREGYLAPGDPDHGWEFRAEDFVYARLAEELAAAKAMPAGSAREAAVISVESLRLAVTLHACYVDHQGRSWARCYTCHPEHGFPCTTSGTSPACGAATLTTRRPGTRSSTRPPDRVGGSRGMLRVAERGGFRNDFLAGEAGQDKAPPREGDRLT